jgi:arogenate dehydrogenase (NADP+)
LVHREATAERALGRGLADAVGTDPRVLEGCALVVLALPLDRLLDPDPALVAALPPAAVVTDVGSVKAPLLARWEPLLPGRFVAGHPMAGTAKAGVEAGERQLFEGRPWVATPSGRTDPAALALVEALAGAVGARWCCCPAADHDRAVAMISHLPVLVGAALLQAAATAGGDSSENSQLPALLRQLASSGFADTTRVGGGNPELGTLMARCNREELLAAINQYEGQLQGLRRLVEASDWAGLQASLSACAHQRPEFL